MMAVQVENAALKRRIEEITLAFQTSMNEVTRLGEELEKAKNGKSGKEK